MKLLKIKYFLVDSKILATIQKESENRMFSILLLHRFLKSFTIRSGGRSLASSEKINVSGDRHHTAQIFSLRLSANENENTLIAHLPEGGRAVVFVSLAKGMKNREVPRDSS